MGKILSAMLSAIHDTDTRKIKDLDQKSDKLKILAEAFAETLHQRIRDNREIGVAFFHETKSYYGSLVRSQNSSTIGNFAYFHRLSLNLTLGYPVMVITLPSMQTMSTCANLQIGKQKGIKAL